MYDAYEGSDGGRDRGDEADRRGLDSSGRPGLLFRPCRLPPLRRGRWSSVCRANGSRGLLGVAGEIARASCTSPPAKTLGLRCRRERPRLNLVFDLFHPEVTRALARSSTARAGGGADVSVQVTCRPTSSASSCGNRPPSPCLLQGARRDTGIIQRVFADRRRRVFASSIPATGSTSQGSRSPSPRSMQNSSAAPSRPRARTRRTPWMSSTSLEEPRNSIRDVFANDDVEGVSSSSRRRQSSASRRGSPSVRSATR